MNRHHQFEVAFELLDFLCSLQLLRLLRELMLVSL